MTTNPIQHTFRNRQFKVQRQVVALAALGLFVAIIIGALYLAQSTSLATLGRQLENLIAQRNLLEQQNEQLREEIAQLRTVPRLLARAQELGFREATINDIEPLVLAGYNPNRPSDEIVLAAAAAPPPVVYEENFIGWLQQQWDAFIGQFQGFATS
jgi:hypothetical protein